MNKEYEVHQDGMMAAGASGKNALADAKHYCLIYGQDGPVELYEVIRKKVDMTGQAAIAAQEPKEAMSDAEIVTLWKHHAYGDEPEHSVVVDFARAVTNRTSPNKDLVAALQSARLLLANTDGLSKNNIDNLASEEIEKIDSALISVGVARV